VRTQADPAEERFPGSFDSDPLNRALDRLVAALGQLDDAPPLLARASREPRAGALLPIPATEASGLLWIAREVHGSIGPAFYVLRTTLVTFALLALMRIKRPEALKGYAPPDLGRIVGLDRAPEVKTLRRELSRLRQAIPATTGARSWSPIHASSAAPDTRSCASFEALPCRRESGTPVAEGRMATLWINRS
jgi:hypothetical protein